MMPPPQYQVHLILCVLRNGPAMNANGVDLEAWLRDDLPKEGWLSEQSAEELEVLHLWSVAVLLDPRMWAKDGPLSVQCRREPPEGEGEEEGEEEEGEEAGGCCDWGYALGSDPSDIVRCPWRQGCHKVRFAT